MELEHSTSDGKCISFPLMYYVDSLLMMTELNRWSVILLQQIVLLYHCHMTDHGSVTFPFASELFTLVFETLQKMEPFFDGHLMYV